jgi:undecaprenol kinase
MRDKGGMKGRPFLVRLGFALTGLRRAWRREASFRFQARVAAGMAGMMFLVRPAPIWIAVVALAAGAVLAVEAVNAALEELADTLHPGRSPGIGGAKDMAAGAVLIAVAVAGVVVAVLAYSVRS